MRGNSREEILSLLIRYVFHFPDRYEANSFSRTLDRLLSYSFLMSGAVSETCRFSLSLFRSPRVSKTMSTSISLRLSASLLSTEPKSGNMDEILSRFYGYPLPRTRFLFFQTLPYISTGTSTQSRMSSIFPMNREACVLPFWGPRWITAFLFPPQPFASLLG